MTPPSHPSTEGRTCASDSPASAGSAPSTPTPSQPRRRRPARRGRRRPGAAPSTSPTELGARVGARRTDALLDSGIDALRDRHCDPGATRRCSRPGVAAGIPTFCEKPVALDPRRTIALTAAGGASRRARAHRVPAPVRPRLPAGAGCGGRPASSASCTPCAPTPTTRRRRTRPTCRPRAASSATATCTTSTSCGSSPAARSAWSTPTAPTRAPTFFTEAGDVDTGGGPLTLDDGTLVLVSSTRYNGAGHDVRMEVHGATGTAGRRARRLAGDHSAEPGVDCPRGPAAPVVHGALPARLRHRADRVRRRRRAARCRARAPSPTRSRRSARPRRTSSLDGRAARPSTSPTSRPSHEPSGSVA